MTGVGAEKWNKPDVKKKKRKKTSVKVYLVLF